MAWQDLQKTYVDQKAAKNGKDHSDVGDIAALLAMSMKGDPMTMLGLGIGRWLRNYLQRGEDRRQEEKLNQAGPTNGSIGAGKSMGEGPAVGSTELTGRPQAGQIATDLMGAGFGNEANPADYDTSRYSNMLGLTRGTPFVGQAQQPANTDLYNPGGDLGSILMQLYGRRGAL